MHIRVGDRKTNILKHNDDVQIMLQQILDLSNQVVTYRSGEMHSIVNIPLFLANGSGPYLNYSEAEVVLDITVKPCLWPLVNIFGSKLHVFIQLTSVN